MDTHHLKTSTTPPVALHLFDDTLNNTISKIANLPIIFSTSNCINLDFYVTLFDFSYSLVLGYNWLTQHNSLIDWVNRLINFHLSLQKNLTSFYVMANTLLASLSFLDISLQSLNSTVSILASEISMSNTGQSNITVIGTAAFLHILKLPGSYNFELCLRSLDIQANSAKLVEASDLFNVPSEYHEFANIFSKTKAEVLTSYYSYNLKINLEEGAQPLVGPIYFFLASEQEFLKESLRKTSTQILSNQPYLYTIHLSYLLRKKIVHCTFVLTSAVLTASLRRITIDFYLSLIC